MPKSSASKITVRIRRGTAREGYLATYQVPHEPGQSVFGVLQYVGDHLDPTLAFSGSCRIGLCTACLVRVNGKVVRACTTLVDGDLLVEPLHEGSVIRDLVTELPAIAGRDRDAPRA